MVATSVYNRGAGGGWKVVVGSRPRRLCLGERVDLPISSIEGGLPSCMGWRVSPRASRLYTAYSRPCTPCIRVVGWCRV